MRKIFLLSFAILLCGCSKDIDFEALENQSPKEIFALGKEEESAKNYSDAVKVFEELERNIPFKAFKSELHEGFVDGDAKISVYTDHQIFDRYQ